MKTENHSTGISAARELRAAKNEWAGPLTGDVLQEVIAENDKINHSEEAQSNDIEKQDKAYAEKQGISGILSVISSAFSAYRDFDYFAADNVSSEEVTTLYDRRVSVLKDWLDSGQENYSQQEKDFLIGQYEDLDTPFYYEYTDGWSALLQNISTFILILALIIGFLTAGIFSDEFQTKADSIFFSTRYGRSRAVLSKAGAGFLITTVFYFVFVLLYTSSSCRYWEQTVQTARFSWRCGEASTTSRSLRHISLSRREATSARCWPLPWPCWCPPAAVPPPRRPSYRLSCCAPSRS